MNRVGKVKHWSYSQPKASFTFVGSGGLNHLWWKVDYKRNIMNLQYIWWATHLFWTMLFGKQCRNSISVSQTAYVPNEFVCWSCANFWCICGACFLRLSFSDDNWYAHWKHRRPPEGDLEPHQSTRGELGKTSRVFFKCLSSEWYYQGIKSYPSPKNSKEAGFLILTMHKLC